LNLSYIHFRRIHASQTYQIRKPMADTLSPAQRSFNMSQIRGKNTRPEMLLRRGLHGRGLRFRLHRRDLPGCPDIVFPRHNVCIFVHGCFWHRHNCSLFRLPATRTSFWKQKINNNRSRDRKVIRELLKAGWRILVVWECAIRGPHRHDLNQLLDQCECFIRQRQTGSLRETLNSRNGPRLFITQYSGRSSF
jgi:DNA mismatch endonuclease, patch repair protein